MKPVDEFRCDVLKHLSQTKSFQKAWVKWLPIIDSHCGLNPNQQQIFTLGEELSRIFKSNVVTGRTQSAVSGGGTAWECLITWYLNLSFWGTDIIVTRQNKKFIPKVVSDSLCVTISNHQTNTESDIVVYSIPQIGTTTDLTLKKINDLILVNITSTDIAVVQCKTNWNDNSQIPMLWDLIYNSSSFRIPNVSIGINGVNPGSFRTFYYSFITVPTIKKPLKSTHIAVLRVKNLTGGNYWGKSTEAGISSCVNEYFGRNFGSYFVGGVQTHINNQISNDPDYYSRFRNLNF